MEISDIKFIKDTLYGKRNPLPIIIGFLIGLYFLTFVNVVNDIRAGYFRFSYDPYLLIYFYSLLNWKIWILRLISAVISYEFARKKERTGIFWFICALLLPAVSLIVLGLLKKKIKDPDLTELITNLSKKFKNDNITDKARILKEIEKKYIEKLKQDRIIFLKNQQFDNEETLMEQISLMEKGIEINIDSCTIEQNEKICFCPACNSKYIEGAFFCPNVK